MGFNKLDLFSTVLADNCLLENLTLLPLHVGHLITEWEWNFISCQLNGLIRSSGAMSWSMTIFLGITTVWEPFHTMTSWIHMETELLRVIKPAFAWRMLSATFHTGRSTHAVVMRTKVTAVSFYSYYFTWYLASHLSVSNKCRKCILNDSITGLRFSQMHWFQTVNVECITTWH